MATAQTRGAMLPEERALLIRTNRIEEFKAIAAHLTAARDMLADSDLDASGILSVFSNAGIPVFPTIVQNILSARYIKHGR
jgi:hypothetical protein